MELVTKPDLQTGDDVRAFTQELRLILRYIGASDADMEKGQMRVEVNLSLNLEGAKKLGTKVEVKNINSISAAAKSVDYEIKRQSNLLDKKEKVIQETRGWDDVNQRTVSQRIKEGSADYRYFPEPDLPPINITNSQPDNNSEPYLSKNQSDNPKSEDSGIQIYLDEIKASISELPYQRRERFKNEYSLPEHDIEVLTNNRLLGNYFEKVTSELISFDNLNHLKRPGEEHKTKLVKLAANYVITEYGKMLSEISAEPNDTKITPEMFADVVVRIFHKEISSSAAQVVLKEMFSTGMNPDTIIHEKELGQVSDADELNAAIEDVISQNRQAVEDYKKGKEASLKFLVGKTMAATKGKANPQVVAELFKKKL